MKIIRRKGGVKILASECVSVLVSLILKIEPKADHWQTYQGAKSFKIGWMD